MLSKKKKLDEKHQLWAHLFWSSVITVLPGGASGLNSDQAPPIKKKKTKKLDLDHPLSYFFPAKKRYN